MELRRVFGLLIVILCATLQVVLSAKLTDEEVDQELNKRTHAAEWKNVGPRILPRRIVTRPPQRNETAVSLSKRLSEQIRRQFAWSRARAIERRRLEQAFGWRNKRVMINETVLVPTTPVSAVQQPVEKPAVQHRSIRKTSVLIPPPGRVKRRICPPTNTTSSTKLLSLQYAREQSTKGIGAVADVMMYARSLGRTLVEPAMKDSRTEAPTTPGALPLSAYYNLTMHRRYVPIMPLDRFRALECVSTTAHLDLSKYSLGKLGSLGSDTARVKKFFHNVRSADLVVVSGLWRSSTHVSLDHPSTHDVPPFKPSDGIIRMAARIVAQHGRPVACASWRTETAAGGAKSLPECAGVFAASVMAQAAAAQAQATTGNGGRGVPEAASILVSTDLYLGNSGTYRRPPEAKEALAIVQATLGAALNVGLTRAIQEIGDSGLRGLVEARICARSSGVLITCGCSPHAIGGRFCRNCTKKDSGFTSEIVSERVRLRRATTTTATNGTFPIVTWSEQTARVWRAAQEKEERATQKEEEEKAGSKKKKTARRNWPCCMLSELYGSFLTQITQIRSL